MNERHNQLLAYVTQHGKTSVDTLADHLQTSKVTIRKDLSELSKRGILKRERGYALPNDPGDIYYRMAFHFEQKQKIARTAAAYVQDGETLIIESGSTCALFAEELAKTKKNITIITNSMYLADYIKGYTDVQLIILGGTLQQGSQSLVGPLTKSAVGAFHVDKIFTGTDGYSHNFGFTGDDLLRSDTLAAMTAASEHIYVLADSGKFTRPGQVSFLKLQDVHEVITDQEIPAAEIDFLKKQGIKITIA
ncbi:MAG: DeoR/GlpR family DNA-binding transcription regulator [Lachnospiraceae bacterium]